MDEHAGLAQVKCRVSGIIAAPLTTVWGIIRPFTQLSDWLKERSDGMSCVTTLLPGAFEYQIGCRRLTEIGGQRYVEELEGMDDNEHCLKYKIINYPGSTNPFPHSLVNFHGVMACRSVTIGNTTFVEWTGTFETEPEGCAQMRHEIESWLVSGLVSMDRYVHLRARRAITAQPSHSSYRESGSAAFLGPITASQLQPGLGSSKREPRSSLPFYHHRTSFPAAPDISAQLEALGVRNGTQSQWSTQSSR